MKLVIAHTPDSDDAFMFYKLVKHKYCNGFYFEHVIKDIEELNLDAINGRYDVTAISFHAYAYAYKNYSLLSVGSSFGLNYGPILVSKRRIRKIKGRKIATPGKYTTASLLLKVYEKDFKEVPVPFDKVLEYVISGKVDAGLLIHEGILNYKKYKLYKVLDLGKFWYKKFKLPVPLGGLAIKRIFDIDTAEFIKRCIYNSIKYSFENFDEAFDYAKRFSRERDEKCLRKFIRMFVNELTLDMKSIGRKSIERLFEIAKEEKLIANDVIITVI